MLGRARYSVHTESVRCVPKIECQPCRPTFPDSGYNRAEMERLRALPPHTSPRQPLLPAGSCTWSIGGFV